MRTTPSPTFSSSLSSEPAQGWEGTALLALILILLAVGLSTLYSASAYLAVQGGLSDAAYLARQVQGALAGALLLVVVSQIDYHRWHGWAWPVLGLATAALIVVLLPGTEGIAPVTNGARRWLRIGPLTVQPSEFTKLALLIWTARTLDRKKTLMGSIGRGLMPLLLVWITVCVLIALEPSMSAAALCLLLVAVLAYVGHARTSHYLLIGGALAMPAWVFITSADYRIRRITAFMDPLADESGSSYQIIQSLTAIGSGGVFGRGFGQSRMKDGFLPEPHNDFASSVLGEEWGFVGMVTLTLLYLTVGLLGHRVARRAPDGFGALLAIAMTALLVVPALLHFAINLSLVPPTGVALPFISYGRSNLMVNFIAAGILLNVAAASCRHRLIAEHLDR